jgi:hypothetical protein
MSMADRNGVIWYNGELVEWRDATTHVLTHTLHYGMGVFEGVRAYATENGPAIFRLKEHTRSAVRFRAHHEHENSLHAGRDQRGARRRRPREQIAARLHAPDGVPRLGSARPARKRASP